MRRLLFPFFSVFFLVIFVVASCWAQAPAIATTATVPPLIKVSGTISSVNSGTVGVNFALYAEQTGGAPLWLETQNVALNANGRYTIYLGANHTNGVPMDLFASGEARWLGVQPEGQAEQARVMLVSVPRDDRGRCANAGRAAVVGLCVGLSGDRKHHDGEQCNDGCCLWRRCGAGHAADWRQRDHLGGQPYQLSGQVHYRDEHRELVAGV